jgi:hypothetical protein
MSDLADLTHLTRSRHFVKRARAVPLSACLAGDVLQRVHSSQGDLFEAGGEICADEFGVPEPIKFRGQEAILGDADIDSVLQPSWMPRPEDVALVAAIEEPGVTFHCEFR